MNDGGRRDYYAAVERSALGMMTMQHHAMSVYMARQSQSPSLLKAPTLGPSASTALLLLM